MDIKIYTIHRLTLSLQILEPKSLVVVAELYPISEALISDRPLSMDNLYCRMVSTVQSQ